MARNAWALCLLAAACGSSAHEPTPGETALRARLGVPVGAKTVVVVSQTAHLDIDWQHTFDDYYSLYVGDVFSEAGGILSSQPRATYSVAEMAFLEHHLAAHPEELAPLQAAAARGALRIVGGGMTSPDTLLPETELLVRDYLYGIQFAEDVLGAHPRAAWLPDSFGHSATVPDVLSAAGFTSVGFSRVDGAPTLIEAVLDPHRLPRSGSTAELLAKLGSADFVWRGAGGARVLAHWMASNLYCTGDNIDYDETLQVPGGHLGAFKGDDPSFTDARIDAYVAALAPLARTPYRFVPVGCDFQHPKTRLVEYLDGYNQRRYPADRRVGGAPRPSRTTRSWSRPGATSCPSSRSTSRPTSWASTAAAPRSSGARATPRARSSRPRPSRPRSAATGGTSWAARRPRCAS